jgi:hypothetical protein
MWRAEDRLVGFELLLFQLLDVVSVKTWGVRVWRRLHANLTQGPERWQNRRELVAMDCWRQASVRLGRHMLSLLAAGLGKGTALGYWERLNNTCYCGCKFWFAVWMSRIKSLQGDLQLWFPSVDFCDPATVWTVRLSNPGRGKRVFSSCKHPYRFDACRFDLYLTVHHQCRWII